MTPTNGLGLERLFHLPHVAFVETDLIRSVHMRSGGSTSCGSVAVTVTKAGSPSRLKLLKSQRLDLPLKTKSKAVLLSVSEEGESEGFSLLSHDKLSRFVYDVSSELTPELL